MGTRREIAPFIDSGKRSWDWISQDAFLAIKGRFPICQVRNGDRCSRVIMSPPKKKKATQSLLFGCPDLQWIFQSALSSLWPGSRQNLCIIVGDSNFRRELEEKKWEEGERGKQKIMMYFMLKRCLQTALGAIFCVSSVYHKELV